MPNGHINPRQFTDTHLECIKCGEMKLFSEFHKDTNKYKAAYWCKNCAITNARKHYLRRMKEEVGFPRAQRNRYVKFRFGMSLEKYEEILARQQSVCAICKVELLASGHGTHLDHSHKTGKIRAFLCTNCNRGLGHFQENIENLKSAIDYLTTHNKSVDLEKVEVIL